MGVPATVESWDLDMDAETLTLTFDEPVDAGTLDATGITIQSAATAGETHTLTGGTTASADGTEIVIDLIEADVNALKLNTDLATEQADSWLVLTADTIDDMDGNSVEAIADGSAMQVDTYTADTTAPLGDLGNPGTAEVTELVITFNEPLHADTLANTTVADLIQDSQVVGSTAGNVNVTNVDGDNSTPEAPLLTLTIDATTFVDSEITTVTFIADSVKDVADNAVTDPVTVTVN